MQVDDDIRNAALNGALALLNGGKWRLREGSTTRVEFSLKNPAFNAAAAGAAQLDIASPTMAASAMSAATDELDNYQFVTSASAVKMSGSISDLAGAGELKMNHPDVELGDLVTATNFTVTISAGS